MKRVPFVGLMVAEGISVFGSRMTFVAMPWLVYVTTGSATRTGVVALAEMLPYVLVCAAGAPLIDRIGARRTSIALDIVSAAVVAAIPLLYQSDRLGFGSLVALVAAAGAVRGLSDTAKRVLFPRTVAHGGVDLTRATTIQDGLGRGAMLVGAPLAGVLIAATDAPTVLWFDAASFLVAALIVAVFVRVPADAARMADADEATVGYVRQLADGVRFVRRDRLVLLVIVMLFVTNMLDQAYSTVLVPVWAREIFGSPVGMGLLFGTFTAGAVAGNVAYGWLAPRLPRFAPFAVGFVLAGAPRYAVLAFGAPLWTIVTVCFAAGVGASVLNPILGATLYERVPERLQARVQGLAIATSWAGIPLGSLLAGWLVDATSVRASLIAIGATYLLATMLPFTSPTWRDLDHRPAPAPEPEPEPAPTLAT